MTEIELLNAIAGGLTTFTRQEFVDFDELDKELQLLVECGFISKIVRAVFRKEGTSRVDRVDVIGGLTPSGELRRERMLAGAS